MRLSRKFYNRKTTLVAKELLGKYLVRRIGRKTIAGIITETEAYCGPKDRASHASKGLTERTKIMFGSPGRAYVYMIYGMYHCFNIVTEREGYPAAVLVRGVNIIQNSKIKMKNYNLKFQNNGQKEEIINGPGRVCREFKIDRKLNGISLCMSKELWIEDKKETRPIKIKRGKRIGVDYAGGWKEKLWRFTINL